MLSRLAPTVSVGAGVVTSMFFFTYLPQVAMLALFEGPVAPISAIPLVLSESSTLFNVIARTFLIEDALIDTFDGTLVARDASSLVAEGRQMKAGNDPIGKLGKCSYSLRSFDGTVTAHADHSGQKALRPLHPDSYHPLPHVSAP